MSHEEDLVGLGPFRKLIELEQRRIDRDNRRADIDQQTLELASAQDERQFRYHSKALEAGAASERERLRFARQLTWALH